ncbi:hypothetical protein NYU56_18515 (plasmid) [Clostridioides difficile]|uniref:hypothetical protein n=1 Tax=Clostridioides difficile TaxID=1496 RepID=UPI0021C7EDA1|nr:hypothetical protein [Clostridioides difficile]UWD43257.1 hypothetical protein NYF05_19360 [Clostridioides difficile]UWD46800.1 hypothetical protein NYU56_18515 [Clostridioides difficile]UWD50684.1 hypothetical protein NYR90_20240 [Clostridioides phage Hain-Saunders-2022a]
MPVFNKDLLEEKEKPLLKSGTVGQENIISTDSDKTLSIYNLVNKKSKKVTMSATLDKELVDKLKSLAIDLDSDVSKILSDMLTKLLYDVDVKEENLIAYNERRKTKNNK